VTLVSLEAWEYERACQVGIQRYTARWTSRDASHYQDKARQEDNRTALVAAAICELAVAKLTNRYWHGHVWHASEHHKYKDLPDVGTNIEVRRLRTRECVAIRKKQNDRKDLVVFAARAVMPELRQVEVLGYIEQKEGWEIGTPADYDPSGNTREVHISKLKKI
jgi:hypothetical protein